MARGEGGGRPKKVIDAETVRKLAAIHCTMEEIAATVDCSVDTLERRFADIIKEGKAQGKSSLRRLQYEAAQKGNITMMIWLGKQLLQQSDKLDQTLNGKLDTNSEKSELVKLFTEAFKVSRERK